MSSKLARFTDRVVSLAKRAVVGEPDPAFQDGDGVYADWVIVAIHGLREYFDHTYRRLLDVLHEMHGIVAKLDQTLADLPDFMTVCTRKQALEMRIWRVLLRLSAELDDTDNVQAIDATGMDRIAASQHYTKRTNYAFEAVKTTTLIDCKTGAILDIHCSMKQPHASNIADRLSNVISTNWTFSPPTKATTGGCFAKDSVQKASTGDQAP